MTRYRRATGVGFAVWLVACSGKQTEATCAQGATDTSPPSPFPRLEETGCAEDVPESLRYLPPALPGRVMLIAPDGLLAQGARCAQDAECSSKVCWQGFCDRANPVFNGGGPVVTGEACARDADCQSVFCDRGVCAQPLGRRNYGIACIPIRPEPQVMPCGPYLCAEGRCRSCQSDAECTSWMGAESCTVFEDFPGKSCGGIVAGLPPKEPATPPPFPPGPRPPLR